MVRDGRLGAVEKAVTVNFAPGLEWTEKAGQPVPEGLDWNLWLNQAPRTPYSGKAFHPGCERWGRWTLFDNGGQSWGMSGWGTHALEQAQRGLGVEETGPTEIILAKPGDPASPVTLVYADGKRIEMKIPVNSGPAWGAIFVGEKGKIEINRWKVVSNPPVKFRRSKGMLPLPYPVDGRLDELKPFLNLQNQENWPLIAGWLIGAVRAEGPYPVLIFQG